MFQVEITNHLSPEGLNVATKTIERFIARAVRHWGTRFPRRCDDYTLLRLGRTLEKDYWQ
jgi:hypothetical protein